MLRGEIEHQLCGSGAVGVGEYLNSGTVVGTGVGTLTLAGTATLTIISGGTLASGAGGETKTSTGTASAAGSSAADAGEAAEGGNMCLPVYGLLLDKPVRDRLGMSKVQQKKLLGIATKCHADQEKRRGDNEVGTEARRRRGVMGLFGGQRVDQGRRQANRGPADARADGGPEGP